MNKTAILCGALAGPALALNQYFIWRYAPVEASMGLVQKIFYFHMPLAWWALFSFFLVFVFGLLYLAKRNMRWDRWAGAAAEVGVVMSGLALVTGSIWGKAAWGVWWTWDPRLSTTLIMWFIYAGYLVFRSLDMAPQRKAMVSAVIGIIAFLDVPLVFFSTRLWPRSVHPPSIGLDPAMKTTIIICLITWGFIWYAMTALRAANMASSERVLDLVRMDQET